MMEREGKERIDKRQKSKTKVIAVGDVNRIEARSTPTFCSVHVLLGIKNRLRARAGVAVPFGLCVRSVRRGNKVVNHREMTVGHDKNTVSNKRKPWA